MNLNPANTMKKQNPILPLLLTLLALSIPVQAAPSEAEKELTKLVDKQLAETLNDPGAPIGLVSRNPQGNKTSWSEIVNKKTGSEWRTYIDLSTGQAVAFNPKTEEVVLNPVTKKFEPVKKEKDPELKASDSPATKPSQPAPNDPGIVTFDFNREDLGPRRMREDEKRQP
ncbi:MAG: hypothetical protein HC904_04770 [Blastochloris sp.]|nr:hypothetical protein [Blastochloris sp.]